MKKSSRPGHNEGDLIPCRECDFLHSFKTIPTGAKALCVRCGAFLYKNIPNSIDRAFALYLAAFILFIMANAFPFISLKLSGRMEVNNMVSGALAFCRVGMCELGILVLLTGFVFPFLVIAGMLYILFPLRFGYRPWKMAKVFRMVRTLTPWSLLGVLMLGVLVSYFKLLDLATVIPGVSLFTFAALLIVWTTAYSNLDASQIWQHMKFAPMGNGMANTAAGQDMIACHTCGLLVPKTSPDGHTYDKCPRCESPIHSRKSNSIIRTWAFIVTAILLIIPANVYPVMTVIKLGRGEPNTIFSGVISLIREGLWGLAVIIFIASVVVPFLKITVLIFLLITVRKKSGWRTRDRSLLYRVTETVGAWSMVDIYAVATLIGLVNFGVLSSVIPDIGATFFAAVVVITMLAAQSFDPRLIWDNSERLK